MPEFGAGKVWVNTAVLKDGTSIVGMVSAVRAKGGYRMAWSAASADGHKMTDEFPFKVG